MGQCLRQQGEQALAVDGFTGGADSALLRHPDEKSAIDQGHAGAAALLAKATVVTGAGMGIFAFHG